MTIDSQNIRSSSSDGYEDKHGKLIEVARQMSTLGTYATSTSRKMAPPTQLDMQQDEKNYHFISAGYGIS